MTSRHHGSTREPEAHARGIVHESCDTEAVGLVDRGNERGEQRHRFTQLDSAVAVAQQYIEPWACKVLREQHDPAVIGRAQVFHDRDMVGQHTRCREHRVRDGHFSVDDLGGAFPVEHSGRPRLPIAVREKSEAKPTCREHPHHPIAPDLVETRGGDGERRLHAHTLQQSARDRERRACVREKGRLESRRGGAAQTRILVRMARSSAPKPAKEPGRMKQMWQVFQMTRRMDPLAVWIMLLALLLPILAGVLLAVFATPGDVLAGILWILTGVLLGILLVLIVLGRRAERVAYRQISGQPGAVGAVLKSSLRRAWQASEMPISVSPKTQDAVYRAVGKPGVVIMGEGPQSRTRRMMEDERRNVNRIVPNVPVHFVFVGPDAESTKLENLAKTLNKFKKVLSKAEVFAVSNRLTSLSKSNSLPIPKGIDPLKARAPKPR